MSSVQFEATAVDHGSITDYSSDDGSIKCYADLDGGGTAGSVRVFSPSYTGSDPLNPSVTQWPVGTWTVECKAIDPNNANLVASCPFVVEVIAKCGDNVVDYVSPFNEQCDSEDFCQDDCSCPDDMEPLNPGCRCCESEFTNCPDEILDFYVDSGEFFPAAPSLTAENTCTGTSLDVSGPECEFSNEELNGLSVGVLTRTWRAKIGSSENYCGVKQCSCEQIIRIHCGDDPDGGCGRRTRRLLHSILAEDEIHDWAVTPSSLRSGAPFTFTKTLMESNAQGKTP